MVIAKTAGRNVAFKVARMRESIMEGQDELILRKSSSEEVGLEDDNQAALDDVGYNADLYISLTKRLSMIVLLIGDIQVCITTPSYRWLPNLPPPHSTSAL